MTLVTQAKNEFGRQGARFRDGFNFLVLVRVVAGLDIASFDSEPTLTGLVHRRVFFCWRPSFVSCVGGFLFELIATWSGFVFSDLESCLNPLPIRLGVLSSWFRSCSGEFSGVGIQGRWPEQPQIWKMNIKEPKTVTQIDAGKAGVHHWWVSFCFD